MSQENDSAEERKREHLNRKERKIIKRMLEEGEIARTLKWGKSTIKREIRRGRKLMNGSGAARKTGRLSVRNWSDLLRRRWR